MLSIEVYTRLGKQPLWLDQAAMQIVANHFLFNRDEDNGTYSIPFEVPMNSHNNKILDFKNIIDGNSLRTNSRFLVDIKDQGIPVFSKAEMYVIDMEYDGQQGTYSIVVTGYLSAFYNAVRNKTLHDIHIPLLQTGTKDSRNFATSVMRDWGRDEYSYEAINKISFAPVYWEDFIDEGREDFNDEKLANSIVNRLFINAGTFRFEHANPSSPGTFINSGAAGYSDYKTVPFFKLRYVLEKLFETFGYQLKGDVLTNTDFNKIHIFNNFAIDKTVSQNNVDPNRFIEAKNHLPATSIREFLSAVQLMTGSQLIFSAGAVVNLDFIEPRIKSPRHADISAYVQDRAKLTLSPEEDKGLIMEWAWDSNDSLIQDRVLDIDMSKVKHFVQSPAEIAALTGTHKDGDLLYCRNENYFYMFSGAHSKWLYYAEGQLPYQKGSANGRRIEIPASPLLQAKGVTETNNNYSLYMVATRQTGSYFTNRHTVVKSDFALRFFYINMHTVGGVSIPISFTKDTLFNGEKVADTSLDLYSENAISRTWYKSIAAMLHQNNRLEVTAVLPLHFNIQQLINSPIRLKNARYMAERVEMNVGGTETKINLIKI